jgi:hypothetical protein
LRISLTPALSQGEGVENTKHHVIEVLSFGEDLGEAKR